MKTEEEHDHKFACAIMLAESLVDILLCLDPDDVAIVMGHASEIMREKYNTNNVVGFKRR